ncbi:MAG: DUF167 domain-containing protein [Patescibacteria group bacterium]
MMINVRVIPNRAREEIERLKDGSLKVWIKAKPIEGEANKRLTEVLAKHFNIPKSFIEIVKGQKSRDKIVDILEV